MATLTDTSPTNLKPAKRKLRYLFIVTGLSMLLLGQALFSAIHWLALPLDSLNAFSLVTIFPYLQYPSYFWTVLLIVIIGVVILLVNLRKTTLLAVLDLEEAQPPPVKINLRNWRIPFWIFLGLTILSTSVTTFLAIGNHGNPPPLWWLAMLTFAGIFLFCADRAANRPSLLSLSELLQIICYGLWLLVLGFMFKFIPTKDLLVRTNLVLLAVVITVYLWKRPLKYISPTLIFFGMLASAGVAIYTYGLYSWQYAFIGDEFSFFNNADRLLSHVDHTNLLSFDGVYSLNPVFASYTHSFTMALYGSNIYGWRISETFMVLLAAPALYFFVRGFAAKRCALLAVAVFLASHHLLALSKVGYNNLQALAQFTVAIALVVLATRRQSWLGYFLSGVATAFTFYTYGITIPFTILIAGLLALNFWCSHNLSVSPENNSAQPPSLSLLKMARRLTTRFWQNIFRAWPVFLVFVIGFVLAALPRLVNYDWLLPLTSKTVVQSEVKIVNNAFIEQILPNFLYTLTATLHFNDNSHYMSGAHLDPISSVLMLIGLGWCIGNLRKRRIALWLVVSFVLGSFFVGGLASYPYPVNTRTFILLPFYAVFAAIGAEFLLSSIAGVKWAVRVARVAVPLLLLGIVGLNLYQFQVLAPHNDPQTGIAMLVKEFQEQPANTIFYYISDDERGDDIRLVLRAYNYKSDRLLILPAQDPENTIKKIKDSAKPPFRILVADNLQERDQWLLAIHDTWPEVALSSITDAAKTSHFTVLNYISSSQVAVTPTIAPRPPRTEIPPGLLPIQKGTWQVEQPRDIAVGPDELIYVINGSKKIIEVFDSTGKLQRSLNGGWKEPFSLAFNSKGELIVLDSAQAPYLTRLSTDGKVLDTFTGSIPNNDFYFPRTVTIDSNDDIYVADTGRSRILRFSSNLIYLTSITVNGSLKQPSSITIVGDKLVIADNSNILVATKQGDLLTSWTVPPFYTAEPPRFVSYQNQTIIVTSPNKGEIELFDLQGKLLQTIGAPTFAEFKKPLGIAASNDGKVYIIEGAANQVRSFDWGK